MNPGDTANCMQERHPGENCPVEWTVAVPQRCVCVQFNAPVERYYLKRSGSTRKHGLRRQRVACGRRLGIIHGRPEQRGAQMHVPAGRAVDDESDGSAHMEGGYAHAAAHAHIERLCGDLRAAQENQSVNCLERNPLATLRVRNQQCPSAMLHAGAMIPNVHRAQVAHPNTVLVM